METGRKRLVTCFGHRAQYESNRWMGPGPLESTWNFLFRKCLFALFGIRMKNSRPFQIQDFWQFEPKLLSLMAPLPPSPPSCLPSLSMLVLSTNLIIHKCIDLGSIKFSSTQTSDSIKSEFTCCSSSLARALVMGPILTSLGLSCAATLSSGKVGKGLVMSSSQARCATDTQGYLPSAQTRRPPLLMQ